MGKRKLNAYELNLLIDSNFDIAKVSQFPSNYPVEYILGKAKFFGYDFFVNKNVLIPRVETEGLVKIAIDNLLNLNLKTPLIADLGTGSGAIGISIYKKLVEQKFYPKIIFSDISKKALNIAFKNISKLLPNESISFLLYNKNSNINIIQSDLFKLYPKITFDLIVANLPYIPVTRKNKLQDSVLKWEPHKALFGGEKGMKYINLFLNSAYKFIKNSGTIFLEVDDIHNEKFFEFKKYYSLLVIKDQNNKNRIWKLKI